MKKLLKNTRLSLLDLRRRWCEETNKENYLDYMERTKMSKLFPEGTNNLRLKVFFAGKSRGLIFYRQQAAEIISRISKKPVAAEDLRHGEIICKSKAETNIRCPYCWYYKTYFVEIGGNARFGRINPRWFNFQPSDKNNEPEFSLTIFVRRYWISRQERGYDLDYVLNADGDLTPKKLWYREQGLNYRILKTIARYEQRFTPDEIIYRVKQDRNFRQILA